MNKFNCEHLIAMGRHIPTPFYLSLSKEQQDEEIKIETILRIVPGKRLIGLSRWRDQAVVVKLFFGQGHWKRNLLSDIRGINLLRQRQIPTPDILHQTTTLDQRGAVLLIDYLEQGESLQKLVEVARTSEDKLSVIRLALSTIARCHREGLWQNDIHLDNFMLVGERVYLLDGGEIGAVDSDIDVQQALNNLALFFAQFTVDLDVQIPHLLEHYQSQSNSLPASEIDSFPQRVTELRSKRLANFEKKLFRSTTANRSIQDPNKFIVYDRSIHSDEIETFLENPSSYINDENTVKAGNASTVARVKIGSKRFILKRYNLKSFWHGFKYLFKTSRAHKSWRNAFVLKMLGVETPTPYLLFEERAFWFLRRKAFYLSEDVDAPNLLLQYEKHGEKELPVGNLTKAFTELFETLITYRISHGDMKASNFIFHKDHLFVLDLDAMQRHTSTASFSKAIKKDLNRFLKNWQGSSVEPAFKDMVDNIKLPG